MDGGTPGDAPDSHVVHKDASLREPEAELPLMGKPESFRVVCALLHHQASICSFVS
jgi:hypothetical protein